MVLIMRKPLLTTQCLCLSIVAVADMVRTILCIRTMHGPETLPRLRDVGNKFQGKLQTLRVTTQNHRIDSSPSSATLVLPFQVTQLKRLEAPVAMAQGALKVANSLLPPAQYSHQFCSC